MEYEYPLHTPAPDGTSADGTLNLLCFVRIIR